MGEHWDPWKQGAEQGGRWGPSAAGDPGRASPTPGGAPGGYVPGGFTPGGFAPGGFTPGGPPPDSYPPDGYGAGFGTTQIAETDLVGTPPKIWLIAALLLGLAAAAVAVMLGASIGYALLAWLLAGPVAIGLLAVFSQRDVRQRSLPIYHSPTWLPTLYWGAVVAAGLGVLSSAWYIAQWAGHL
jgi:hypothetical protein